MEEEKFILALDQGTSSSRALLVNKAGKIVAKTQQEIPQYYPQSGWVEQNPMEILESQLTVIKKLFESDEFSISQINSIGITNQRETTIVWNKLTGKPIYNAIVWQDKRTTAICSSLEKDGWGPHIHRKTGLVIDSYFSATKIKWILQHTASKLDESERENLIFGTVDTWLLWNLTSGAIHSTDYTNASRTMLYDIKKLKWDNKLLEYLDIPKHMLPKVNPSSHFYGHTKHEVFGDHGIPITGMAGDQQAALFGQAGFKKGMAKNTYGTGCFILMNTGSKKVVSTHGLLTTLTCGTTKEKPRYALEGSVFMAGAAIKWLRDSLHLIDKASETETIAEQLDDTDQVYMVPAFSGLGAPYWDMFAKGAIVGLTLGSTEKHIVKATLESLAYQSLDVIDAMEKDAMHRIKVLNVDGGASANNYLMQFQSDLINRKVNRPDNIESTAMGAAYLAGLASGFWKDRTEILVIREIERVFEPNMEEESRENLKKGWANAVAQVRHK